MKFDRDYVEGHGVSFEENLDFPTASAVGRDGDGGPVEVAGLKEGLFAHF